MARLAPMGMFVRHMSHRAGRAAVVLLVARGALGAADRAAVCGGCACRVIAAHQRPDHATIARFVERHELALAGLFSEMPDGAREPSFRRSAELAPGTRTSRC